MRLYTQLIAWGFVLICNVSPAQVPGYLGKRLSIGYKLDLSPAGVTRFLTNAESIKYDGTASTVFTPSYFHNLDLEYVISRKISLRASYGISRTGLRTYDSEQYYYEALFLREQYPKLSSYYDELKNDSRDYDFLNLNNSLVKLGFSYTKGNYIAPHGNAHSLYFLTHTAKCNYVLGSKSTPLTEVTSYGLMYERSSRRIVKDCVLLEMGISFGYLFGGGLDISTNRGTIAEYITTYQNSQLLFQVSLGVRYLAPQIKL